jgi:hypothetical protein
LLAVEVIGGKGKFSLIGGDKQEFAGEDRGGVNLSAGGLLPDDLSIRSSAMKEPASAAM